MKFPLVELRLIKADLLGALNPQLTPCSMFDDLRPLRAGLLYQTLITWFLKELCRAGGTDLSRSA